MKDEGGFFTVIGLCFLLAVSICIKNIQESEAIYSFNAADYQAEIELQNVADSALLEAVEQVKLNPALVPKPRNYYGNREDRQHKILNSSKNSARLKNIKVEVYGEHGNIHSELGKNSNAEISIQDKDGVILISVASADFGLDGKKIYRRSLAFFYLEGDATEKIFYLNSL